MLGLQGEIVRGLEALRYTNDYSRKSRSCIATLPIRERPAPCETVWKGPITRKGPDFGPERCFAKTKVVRVSRDLQCTNDFREENRSRTEELPIRERLSSFREGFGSRRGAAVAVFRGRRVAGGVEAGCGRNSGQGCGLLVTKAPPAPAGCRRRRSCRAPAGGSGPAPPAGHTAVGFGPGRCRRRR